MPKFNVLVCWLFLIQSCYQFVWASDLKLSYQGHIYLKDPETEQYKAFNKTLCHSGDLNFLDYSIRLNAYVGACVEVHVGYSISIIKIDERVNCELKMDPITVFQSSPSVLFAFDWLHGLLYVKDSNELFLTDLKKAPFTRNFVHRFENTVGSILFRPELNRIYWAATMKKRFTFKYESLPDGSNVTYNNILNETLLKMNFEYNETFYVLLNEIPGTKAYLIDWDDTFNNIKIESNLNLVDIHYKNRQLIIMVYQTNDTKRQVIYTYPVLERQLIEDKLIKLDDLTNFTEITSSEFIWTFVIFDPDSRKESLYADHCLGRFCSHNPNDFCLGLNETHSKCFSGFIFPNYETISMTYFWIYIGISIIILLLIFILLLNFIFFSKEQSSFYQIRLKKLQRVESSKRPPGSSEIPD